MFDELFTHRFETEHRGCLAFYRDAIAGEVTYRYAGTGGLEFVAIKMGRSSVGIARQCHRALGLPLQVRC